MYGGTISGSSYTDLALLILEDGEFWSLYGTRTGGVFFVGGFIEGNGTSSNGNFTASNAEDFGASPPIAATVKATYNPAAPSISGTFTSSSGTFGFSAGAPQRSLYNYATPANLNTIVGNWSLTDLSNNPIALSIATNGSFTATSGGCSFTGNFVPRPSGKNVFNVNLTFGPSPCVLANQTAGGIAIADPLATGKTQLLIVGVNGARTSGTVAFGQR